MKTPQQKNDDEQQRSLVSFPTEIVEDILTRLPVKSILQSRSVSKTWLSLISHPSFNKLHFTRATTGFFITAYDYSTKKRSYLTAGKDGGPLTKIMTVDEGVGSIDISGPTHLNGLICFTNRTYVQPTLPLRITSRAFVVNPATRRVFHLSNMNFPNEYAVSGYLYGLDQSVNEYKIMLIKKVYKTEAREFMIFSMESLLWRKINVDPHVVGFDWDRLVGGFGGGVCVNSVVHLLLNDYSYDILAFDFVKEKFSVISIPDANPVKFYIPSITIINGCLGVVVHDRERSEVRVWRLQDYQKRVWVNETIEFPKSWNDLVGRVPMTIDVNMDDEIVFCLCKRTENVITIPVYNMKTKCFKSVQFSHNGQFTSLKTVSFCNISCYIETIMPLVDNWSKTSHGQAN